MVSSLMAAGLSDVECLGAARSTFRVTPADVVEALLDGGEARFDHRLEFEVGEDIGPVLFDTFADEFTDIEGIYALRDALPDHIDLLGKWARCRQGTDRPFKALGKIASRVHDLRARNVSMTLRHSSS